MTKLINRLHSEDGVAMVIVMGVMATLLVLTGVVVSSSNLVGRNTTTDTARKRAFEAAEAGLQATAYRLNMLSPATSLCIGGSGESVLSPSEAGATCAGYTEDLGNGASFTSWTTATLSNGATCAGLQVGAGSSIDERCVTASGTFDGVTRRVQARVASYAAAPLFPLAGVTGLHSITITGGTTYINASEGSNGQISMSGGASAHDTTLGPSAPNVSKSGSSTPGPVTRRTAAQGPFQLAPVDPGNSATVNDDGRLTNALAVPKGTPADSVSAGVTWNAATRSLNLSGASVVLGGGIYNFCKLNFSGGSTISIAPGARTAIYIDSPQRAGSGCASGDGTINMSGGSSFINNSPPAAGSSLAHDPTALQLYVVGKTGSTVVLSGASSFYGTIYAPTSTLNWSGSSDAWGAIAANDITLSGGSTFNTDLGILSITTNSGGLYFRTAWRECLATSPDSNPGSGC